MSWSSLLTCDLQLQITPLFGIFTVLQRVVWSPAPKTAHGDFILKGIPGNATKTGSMELWSTIFTDLGMPSNVF